LETGPDWNIPQKIFNKELLPKAIKNHRFLENNHIAVYDKQENYIAINTKSLTQIRKDPSQFHAKQSPGCDNALGKVVFRFTNAYSIYLHDTPEQQYFDRNKRALSHGCIRVEHADVLAGMLLKRDGQIAAISQLKQAMSTYSREKFFLATPVPILITYQTIAVEDGLLVRHDDLYKLDKILIDRMFKLSEQPAKTKIN
jgi:murein L,D-transpeptidase YcbB/YkuD